MADGPKPKIKASVLYKYINNAYGPNGKISKGAFRSDLAAFEKAIYNDEAYAQKIYGAMNSAYGEGGKLSSEYKFNRTRDSFINELGFGVTTSSEPAGEPTPPPQQSSTSQPISMYQGTPEEREAIAYATGGAKAMQVEREQNQAVREYNKAIDKSIERERQLDIQEAQNLEKAQREADELYKKPLGELYYNYVLPIHRTSINQLKNVEAFVTRKLGFDELADDIASDFSFERIAREGHPRAKYLMEPTAHKGKIGINNVLPKTMETLTSMLYLLGGAEAAGGGKAAMFASSFIQNHEDYRTEAKRAGLTNAEADEYANQASAVTSALELVSPNRMITKGIPAEVTKKMADKAVFKAIRDGVGPREAIKKAVGGLLKETGEEVGQEYLQAVGDNAVRVATSEKFNQDHIIPTYEEFKDIAILTVLATGMASSPSALRIGTDASTLEKSAWFNAAKDIDTFNSSVDRAVERGTLDQSLADRMKKNVGEYKQISDALQKQGYTENAVSRMALDAFMSKRLDEETTSLKGISALAPVKETIEATKKEMENRVRDAVMDIPDLGTVLSSEEVAEKMKASGGEGKIDKLGIGEYRMDDIDLKSLYNTNESFKNYVDNEKLRPDTDKEGLRMPVVLNADGTIVDGMNRLAQQYADGNATARAFIEKPIKQTEKIKENAVQISSPEEMDVRQQTGDGETMAEGNAEGETITEEGTKGKEEIVESPMEEPLPNKLEEYRKRRTIAKDRLKDAWSKYKKIGIIDDPESRMERDRELFGALVGYIKEELLYRLSTVKGFNAKRIDVIKRQITKSISKEGVQIRDAKMIGDAFNEAYKQFSNIPGVVSTTPQKIGLRKLYKDRIIARAYGQKKGRTEGIEFVKNNVAEAKKEVLSILKEAKGKASISEIRKIVNVFSRVSKAKTDKGAKTAFDNAAKTAAQIVYNVANRNKIAEANNILKRVKKLRRNKGMVLQDKAWIASTSFPQPNKVEDLDTYINMLKDYEASRSGKATDFKYTKEEISDFIDNENTRIHEERMDALQAEMDALKNEELLPSEMTLDQYIEMLDNETSGKEIGFNESKDDILKRSLKERILELKERLKEYDGTELNLAKRLSEVDPDNLNAIGLRIFNNVLNNLAEYGTFDNAGRIIIGEEAAKTVKNLKESNVRLRILPPQKTLNKNTLTNTVSALFHNSDVAAMFRSKTFGPVEIAISKYVKPQAHKFSEELSKIYKKHDMGSLSDKKLSQFAFMNQWRTFDDSSISEELKYRLNKRLDDIMYMYDKGKKLGDKEGKSFMDAAADNLDAMKALGFIKDYSMSSGKVSVDINNDLFSPDNPTIDLDRAYDALSAGEKEAYNLSIKKFEETVDEVEDFARIYEGKNFERIPGGKYFPMTPIHKTKTSDTEGEALDLSSTVTPDFVSLNKKPASLLKERAKVFSDDIFYGTDFQVDAVNAYWTALYTSKVMPEVLKLDEIIRNDDFRAFVTGKFDQMFSDKAADAQKFKTKGEANFESFKKQLVQSLNEEKRSPFFSKKGFNVLDEIVNRSVKSVLGNIWQAPSQYIPSFFNNFILNNKMAVMYAVGSRGRAMTDSDYAKARQELLSYMTGVQRSARGQQFFDKTYKAISESKSWWQYPLDWQEKLQDISSYALEKSDKWAQNDAYIASYITSLIHQGEIESVSDFDIYKEAKHPNREAIAFAENRASEINNESAKGYRPAILKNKDAAKYLWLLQSFNLNAFRNAKQQALLAFGRDQKVSSADRKEALNHLMGYAAQIAGYNMVRQGIRAIQLAAGYQLIKALFDIDREEETEELKEARRTKERIKSGAAIFSDIFLGGQNALIRSAFQQLINTGYKFWADTQLAKKKKEAKKKGEKVDPAGTYLSPFFSPYYNADDLPGVADFYFNLGESGLKMALSEPKEMKKNAPLEDKKLHEMQKYIAPLTIGLGLGDLIVFERSIENALRKNKEAKKFKEKEKKRQGNL